MTLSQIMTNHQIYLLHEMINGDAWKLYQLYISNLIYDYLNTSESKDFLRGIKFSLTKFESEIERYVNDKY